MIQQKDVTIIVPTLSKTAEQAYSLNESLTSLIETCECNIVVIANGVDDENLPIADYAFDEKPNKVKVIILEDQGQCKAVNAAVATTNTPWIMVTNDDMIYPPGWFNRLTVRGWGTCVQDYDDDILCISPKLVEPRPGAPTFKEWFCGGAGGDFDKQKFLKYVEDYELQNNGLATGFNLPFLIRKDLWDLVGGYDVNYDPWSSNSDSDLEYKIKLAGVQPYQQTNCLVYHFSQTSGTFEPRNQGYWGKNWQYFIDKWGFPRTDEGIWQASFTIPAKEEGRKFNPWWENFYKKS